MSYVHVRHRSSDGRVMHGALVSAPVVEPATCPICGERDDGVEVLPVGTLPTGPRH